jgi:phosphatidylglycerophosphate synthase
MFDRQLLALSKPLVDRIAATLARRGNTADEISITGFGFGMIAIIMISSGHVLGAIAPLLINRLLDGVDGALARMSEPTDRGAFLDITLDFLFYAGVPLAFAFYDRANNALPAAVLLAAFIGTGVTFLAFAIMAEKRGEKSAAYPSKAFYYLGGLAEGFETVVCFVAMCLFPAHFALIAYIYAAMCCVTTFTRMVAGWKTFGAPPNS